ncbi:MAG: hypothetical protein V1806_14985 [Pseudomonadota bacterium]
MVHDEHDVEALLEQQLAYHLEKAARCRRALDAYKGIDDTGPHSRGITWAAAIDEAFQENEQLTIDELRAKLVEKGLPAHDDQSLNTIRGTLSRKAGEGGTLERVSVGVYRRKLHGEIGKEEVLEGDETRSNQIIRRAQGIQTSE